MADQEEKISEANAEDGYEKRDIPAGRIIAFGILGALLIVIMLVIVTNVFLTTSEKMVEDVVLKPQSVAIRELRARETEELNSYKLLDPEKGIYQIPIDRAIELMADEAYRDRMKKEQMRRK